MIEGRVYIKDFLYWDGMVWVEFGGIKNVKKVVVFFFWEIYRGVWGGEGKEEFFVIMLLLLL